jgi:hypothetical protein
LRTWKITATTTTTALLLLVPSVSGASAATATTDAIVKDAQDGHIDGLFTPAELNATLASPLLKTYGGAAGVEAVRSALGAQTTNAGVSGNLPFTGAEMVTFALLGSTLLLGGFVLRRQARPGAPNDDH